MSPSRGGLVLSMAFLLAALLSAPAHAERDRETDPAGDMGKGYRGASAPEQRNLDLRRVVVRHTQHRVVIRADMRALNVPKKSQWFGLYGYVKVNPEAQPQPSDGNVAWSWEVEFNKSHREYGTRLFILDAEYQEMGGCSGFAVKTFHGRAYYKVDVVRVAIPRGCLADHEDHGVRPKWVQVSVSTSYWDGSQSYQDGLCMGSKPWPPFTRVHYTRRLYPGKSEETTSTGGAACPATTEARLTESPTTALVISRVLDLLDQFARATLAEPVA